jgi:hypothetical protein
MAKLVVTGAKLKCSFGNAPGTLMVLPVNRVTAGANPVANVMDNKPMVNIMPFGMCSSMANPQVAAATAAALGVLTPMPCIPVTVAPWSPGSPTVKVGNMPALNDTSKCQCTWGGIIEIQDSGQNKVETP